MKLSLKPITAHKKASLQDTVRRLIIILLSFFFFLIIRASIWSPYGKNLPDPRYDQQDDQYARYWHTPFNPRIHLVLLFLSSNQHFRTLTLKFSFNPITKDTMSNFQNTVDRVVIIVFMGFFLLIIRAAFWSSQCEIRAEPHCGQKYGQFPNHCHRPFIHRFPLVYLYVSCKQHSGVFTEKFLRNQITTHKMASLKNIVTSLRIIVHCYSYSACQQALVVEKLDSAIHRINHYPADSVIDF